MLLARLADVQPVYSSRRIFPESYDVYVLKTYLILALIFVAGLNLLWRVQVSAHRPSLEQLNASVELDGRLERRHIGKNNSVETRIDGTLVSCVWYFARGVDRQCPLDRVKEGDVVRSSIVEVPGMGGAFVIKTLRLADGTSYSVSGEEILGGWELFADVIEIAVTLVLVAGCLLFGWLHYYGSYQMPADIPALRGRGRS